MGDINWKYEIGIAVLAGAVILVGTIACMITLATF